MLIILTSAIFLSILIGYLGRNRRIGFWGLAFGSILLTPVVGLIILMVTADIGQES